MIALREAREEARELFKDIPGLSALRQWVILDCITGPEKYINKGRAGGRVGLYDETLPVQIAVIAEIRHNRGMKEVARLSQKVKPKIMEADFNIGDQQGKLRREALDKIIPGHKQRLELDMNEGTELDPDFADKLVKWQAKIQKISEEVLFLKTWAKYEAEYRKKQEQNEKVESTG